VYLSRTRVQNLLSQNLPPALLTVIVGDSPEQQSYVRIKRRIADELGVQFYLWQCAGTIRQDEFISQLHLHIHRYRPNGVLIQQPLPNGFDPKLIFSQLPPALDIEGIANHIYTFPLVQAALIGLTYAYDNTQNTFCLPAQLTREIVQWLEEKHIVIGGRGATSGAPIARYFDHLQIPYSTTNSQIEDADSIYRTADIIITGVGKKILTKMNIKAGVILLNFGLLFVPQD
jgi:methylenetetrahydrofolate dehydrogenase (NADP+)/methenyltetrahydrofolate cyclohydrolase